MHIFDVTYNSRLPADELQLAIVEPKPLTLASGVSVKDDFFIHTPRETIAEMIECRQVLLMLNTILILVAHVIILQELKIIRSNFCRWRSVLLCAPFRPLKRTWGGTT